MRKEWKRTYFKGKKNPQGNLQNVLAVYRGYCEFRLYIQQGTLQSGIPSFRCEGLHSASLLLEFCILWMCVSDLFFSDVNTIQTSAQALFPPLFQTELTQKDCLAAEMSLAIGASLSHGRELTLVWRTFCHGMSPVHPQQGFLSGCFTHTPFTHHTSYASDTSSFLSQGINQAFLMVSSAA